MDRMLKHRTRRQEDKPNFRSVGSKAYDFNRLKYTTSYRAFGRKSLPNLDTPDHPQPDKQKQQISLNLKLNQDKQKDREQKVSNKKIAVMIDKWKQRYEKAEDKDRIFFQKRPHDLLPIISKTGMPLAMISTKEKFHFVKNLSESNVGRETLMDFARKMEIPKPIIENNSNTEEFHKYEKQPQLNAEDSNKVRDQYLDKKLKYALGLDRKINYILKAKKKSLSNLQQLRAVEEMPERWQITMEDQWN